MDLGDTKPIPAIPCGFPAGGFHRLQRCPELGVRTMANRCQNQYSPSPDSVLGFAERKCQLPAGSRPVGKHVSDDFEKQVMAVEPANRGPRETSIGFQTSAAPEALNSGSGLPPFLSSAATAVWTPAVSLSSPFYFGQRCTCPTHIHGARKQIFDLVRIQLRQLIKQRSKQVRISLWPLVLRELLERPYWPTFLSGKGPQHDLATWL